jgi:uncharacterized protein
VCLPPCKTGGEAGAPPGDATFGGALVFYVRALAPPLDGPRDTARAMSQENVELVRALYAEIWGGDRPPDFTSRVDPQVEIVAWPNFPDDGVLSGRAGFELWTKRWSGVFEHYDLQPERFWEGGEFVVAALHERARAGRSGIPIDEHYAHLWTIRDGRVVRVQVFRTPEEALEAAGLRE